jgi:hypothetical protein
MRKGRGKTCLSNAVTCNENVPGITYQHAGAGAKNGNVLTTRCVHSTDVSKNVITENTIIKCMIHRSVNGCDKLAVSLLLDRTPRQV